MRTTQFIGLNERALKFIREAELRQLPILASENKYGKQQGMFDEDLQYQVLVDKYGNLFWEVTQASPWSSGPMLFTCLKMEPIMWEGRAYGPFYFGQWTEEEIDAIP